MLMRKPDPTYRTVAKSNWGNAANTGTRRPILLRPRRAIYSNVCNYCRWLIVLERHSFKHLNVNFLCLSLHPYLFGVGGSSSPLPGKLDR